MPKSAGIQRRTAATMLGVALLVLVILIIVLAFSRTEMMSDRVEQTFGPYADVIIASSTHAVDTGNPLQAGDILDSLKSNPLILQADIIEVDGHVLAAYPTGKPLPQPSDWQRSDGVYLAANTADLIQSYEPDEGHAARLFMRMSLSRMREHDWQTVRELILGGIFLLAIMGVTQFFLLRRGVLRPIERLAGAAEDAAERGDYRQRVPVAGQDEISLLGKNFNLLLANVGSREAALRRLSRLQQTIVNEAAYTIVSTDLQGLITSFNPAAEHLFGCRAADVIGRRNLAEFADPQELAARARELSAHLGRNVAAGFETLVTFLPSQKAPVESEWNIIRAGGDSVPILLSVSALKDEQNQPAGHVFMAVDIIRRKKAVAELRDREEKYRQLFENMTTGFALHEIICDAGGKPVDYRFIEVNPAFGQLTGLDPAQLVGRTVREILPHIEDHWIETYGRVALTGEPVAYQNYSRELRRHFDAWAFSPKRGQFAVVFSDISERKKFELESQQKNSLLEATLQATADGILVVSGEGKITSHNRQLVELLRVPPGLLETQNASLLGEYLLNLMANPASMARRMQHFNDTSKSETFDVLELADGRILERFSRPQFVEGRVVGRVWSFRDVTSARNAESALRESEHKFKTLFETANDAILLMNESVFLDCNKKAEWTYGCDRDKLIGASPVQFSPERQADGVLSRIKAADKIASALAGYPQSFEWIHCRADGHPFNAEVSLNRLELEGVPVLQAIVRDITARKSAEAAQREAEQLYRTLVNTSPDGIAVLDMSGFVRFASPKDLEMFGLPDMQAKVGRHALEFVPESEQARAKEVLMRSLTGDITPNQRFIMVRADGERFTAEVNGTLLRDDLGVARGLMIITRDVTDRQRQEDELTRKNEELERFTYTVSHDLKSPLITIKGFAGALLTDVRAGRADRMPDDLKRIVVAADKMGQLLNGLLELSRVGRIVNPPVQVFLTKLADDVVELLSGSIQQRGARVEVQRDLPPVQGDPQRLQQVLQNLIENALKFSREDVPPVIEVGTAGLSGQDVFFVRDNGRGIEPRFRETIFGLFNKLDAQSEGTGIGLALVRRIVEFHGGRIWVESRADGPGAVFYFTLPPGAVKTTGSQT